jgi:hypothetical protein
VGEAIAQSVQSVESAAPRKRQIPDSPRVRELIRLRCEIDQELRRLLGTGRPPRPWYHCLRCGYDWQGYSLERPPLHCARCHTAGWNEDPIQEGARTPESPPSPRWRKNRRRRKPNPARMTSEHASQSAADRRPWMPAAYDPPPAPLNGLTPPPRLSLSSQLARRIESEPNPETQSSHSASASVPSPIPAPSPSPVEEAPSDSQPSE